MENDKKPFEFNIVGLPQNDDIEVSDDEEETPKQNRKQQMPGGMPKEIEDFLEKLVSGIPDDALEEIFKKYSTKISSEELSDVEKMLNSIWGEEEPGEEDEEESSEEGNKPKKFNFELGKISHLFKKDAFKQILIEEDPNLYISFVEKYGKGPFTTVELSDHDWTCLSACPIPLTKITEFTIVDFNNRYILLYGTSNDKTEQGIFMAVTKDPNGEYQLIIPEYGNTYDLVSPDKDWADDEMFADDPKNCKLYSSKQPELFNEEGRFKFLDLDKIAAGLTLLLTAKNDPLVSVNDFGSVIQMRSTVELDSYSQWLRIGVIKSNGSSAAELLKKDFDIPEDKQVFDFYLRFQEPINGLILNSLADYINAINLSETLLFDNSELKVKGRGDKLYIDFDIGVIADKLPGWIDNKGNSEF